MRELSCTFLVGLALASSACVTPDDPGTDTEGADVDVYRYANGCFSVRSGDAWLTATADGSGYEFVDGGSAGAARFFLKASDLGTYLLYDADGGYLVAEDGPLLRQTTLEDDMVSLDDTFISGAEWVFEGSGGGENDLHLRNRRTDRLLGRDGLADSEGSAAVVNLEDAAECTEHPEASLDADGAPVKTTFDDGDLYGIVDTHSHILSNFAFGGGSIFHGAAFHRLGVEHALPDCDDLHGEMGRKDFFGYVFDGSGADSADISKVLPNLVSGELDEDNHATEGWPTFTEWPAGPKRSTHQTQYYKWLQRAHLAGLRLVVQHATTNSIICHMTAGSDIQPVRYSCEDMVAVDRIIEETYNMEAYIDAQEGGPGQGWFRIVKTPAEAREVIAEGKMAVILGIETSDVFDCRLVPRENSPVCDNDYIVKQLDEYYERGIRVLFPVHKYDNMFSAGDGDRAFIELGNFFNTGYYGNFVTDCPNLPDGFDRGSVAFGGLNMPRDQYVLAEPPNDFSDFPNNPIGTAFPFVNVLDDPPLEGDYCQNHGLSPQGEFLMTEMMKRGMIIEVDHLPQKSYVRAFEILEENDYPAAGTHGRNYEGKIYELGGISKTGLGRCRDPQRKGAMLDRLNDRVALITEKGGYPAEGFGFDLNGFAGAPGPRFGDDSGCGDGQVDPITYPFDSFAGDVTFTQPYVGDRELDFNTEGLVHIGMLPELIQDARADAENEADLEPLFRSAEGYIRMWERAEARKAALGG